MYLILNQRNRVPVPDGVPNMSSKQYDRELYTDMEAICSMIQISHKHELQTEVLMWFGIYRANGEPTDVACEMALAEWIK